MNLRRFHLTALPPQIDFKGPARAQALYAPFRPGRWRRRQQMNLPRVALQQHLCDAGGGAEIAVNLERRVNVEQVGQRRFGEQREQVLVSLLSVLQPRPEIDDPRAAPSRVPASVFESVFKRLARGGGQI